MTTAHDPPGPVLVVGGGPVGLTIAADLLRQGIAVRIITAERVESAQSRAIVVWPRSLELLRRIGVSETMAGSGHHIGAVRFYADLRHLASAHMSAIADTPYPYGLMIPQSRTEAILRSRLEQLGGVLESGVTLTGLDIDGPRPVARLRHPGGAEEEVEVDWVVGADGAHSATRSLLGVPFPAQGREVLFAIGDGSVTDTVPNDALLYSYSAAGALGLAPLGGDLFRIAFAVPRWDRPDGPPPEAFQAMLDRLSPAGGALQSLRWSGVFRARRQTAPRFRIGRCFLVGDAAHVFSAAGAQGMNTGLQDALNLGWKLGGVIRGRLAPSILDTYDAERRPQVARVSLNTARQTEWGLLRRPASVTIRNGLVRLSARTGVMQRAGAPLMSQTDVTYGRPLGLLGLAGLRRRLRPGMRMAAFVAPDDPGPDPAARFPRISAEELSVLLWKGSGPARTADDGSWQQRLRDVRAAVPRDIDVVELAPDPGLVRQLGHRRAAVIVRPDGHVTALLRRPTGASVRQALQAAGVRDSGVRDSDVRDSDVRGAGRAAAGARTSPRMPS
jgi:2-polyprenyl-6-methoxyphenol hydroxylase-like FAD-dependent oxidoreductase